MFIDELKVIYSLFDYSGSWSKPYKNAGYFVRQIDIKHGDDVRWLEVPKEPVYGILAAPPCTDFSASGAQYWKEKDGDGRTLKSLELIGAMARFILAVNPHFWVVENPVGRLKNWFGEPRIYFNPYDYGGYCTDKPQHALIPENDAYTKKTALWGKFRMPRKKQIQPIFKTDKNGSKHSPIHMATGGGGEDTKTVRSITPAGFAQAFFEVNR